MSNLHKPGTVCEDETEWFGYGVRRSVDVQEWVRRATDKQIEYGKKLGLDLTNATFRVAQAMLSDRLEVLSFEMIRQLDLKAGDVVTYHGTVEHLKGRAFVVSSVGKHGMVHFRGGGYAAPWNLDVQDRQNGIVGGPSGV